MASTSSGNWGIGWHSSCATPGTLFDRSVCPGGHADGEGYGPVPLVLSDRMPTVPRPGVRALVRGRLTTASGQPTTPVRTMKTLVTNP